MVTTARASGTREAAARTAAPPRLWPMRMAGARLLFRSWSAAAIRSATLDENVVLANSPSLAAETGEIETQYRDIKCRQRFGDATRSVNVLAAGEAVHEQGVGARCRRRTVEQ